MPWKKPKLKYVPYAYLKDMVGQELCDACRINALYMVAKAGKGHLGTSLSSMEAIVAIDAIKRPADLFFSSKGHDAAAQYALLIAKGILGESYLNLFRTAALPSHPTINIPGILCNSGSLGMGLSKAVALAYTNKDKNVYVLLGDGELMEGQNWEAALHASRDLSNLTVVVDCNQFSQDGAAKLSAPDIRNMFEAAGWDVIEEYEGNDYDLVYYALRSVDATRVRGPQAVILHTTKGCGIGEFEGKRESHAGPPKDYEAAVNDIVARGFLDPTFLVISDYAPAKVVSCPHRLYKAFGEVVEEILQKDEKAVFVGADTLRDLNVHRLKIKFPGRVFDVGIAEQHMVSFAAGLALQGYRPIVGTYARFLLRALDQIYNQTTEGTSVYYVGTMAGPLPEDGGGISHQSLHDGLIMGTMMEVFTPTNKRGIRYALNKTGPLYIRLLEQFDK